MTAAPLANLARDWLRRWSRRGDAAALTRPLLSLPRLQALQAAARALPVSPFGLRHDSQTLLQGDNRSRRRGSGLDYDESRPFHAGDDRRHIHWRLYARTGELFVKQFHEERRPQCYLVLDRRQPMRMGTRRLKLEAAVEAAALLLYRAHAEGMALGGVTLDDTLTWLPASSAPAALANLLDRCNAAAPPLPADAPGPGLSATLAQLQAQRLSGAIVCIVSDFHDLDAAELPRWWQLCRDHEVIAVHLADPLEQALPARGVLHLGAAEGAAPLAIDCADAGLRQRYAEHMQRQRQRVRELLQQAGARYYRLSTEAAVAQLFAEVGHGA